MSALPDGLVLAALALQGALPAALVAHLALVKRRGRVRVLLDAAFVALYLAGIGLAGFWLALPRWLVTVWAVLLVGAAAHRIRRTPRETVAGAPRGLVSHPWIRGMAVLCAAAVVLHALQGRRPLPGEAVELAFPLAGGPYRVAAGGSVLLLNPHLGTLDGERFRPYRGQSYGVDLVGVGAWGSRRSGLDPEEPRAYAAFGAPVLAPCAGTVVHAADGEPDRTAPGVAPASLEGNHVILACGGAWVVLAHLARGSVAVATGDPVEVGRLLGRVGNSGSSDEPHLHIHAQTPGTPGARLGGSPLPVAFEGRQPVRNDRLHGRPEDPYGGRRWSSPYAGSGRSPTLTHPSTRNGS